MRFLRHMKIEKSEKGLTDEQVSISESHQSQCKQVKFNVTPKHRNKWEAMGLFGVMFGQY